MALQPKDHQKIKHSMRTVKRRTPALVNRSNKRILMEIAPEVRDNWNYPYWWYHCGHYY